MEKQQKAYLKAKKDIEKQLKTGKGDKMKVPEYPIHADMDFEHFEKADEELMNGISTITLFSLFFGLASGIVIGIIMAKFNLFGL